MYQVTDVGEPWLWVRITNPSICQILHGKPYIWVPGEGFITLAAATVVPASNKEMVFDPQSSIDVNNNPIDNSVEVVTEKGLPGNTDDATLANRAQIVVQVIADSSASVATPSSPTMFVDTSTDGNGSFFLVGSGKGDIKPGKWLSKGLEPNGNPCAYTIFSSAQAYNIDLASGGNGFAAEIGSGKNTGPVDANGNTTITSMSFTAHTGNLVLGESACGFNLSGS